MKTRNFIYLALAFVAMSCAKEIAPETDSNPSEKEINYVQKTFTASHAPTKTTMVNGYQIEWKKNDAVTVIDNVSSSAVKYLASEAGAVTTLTPESTGVSADATEIFGAIPWRDGNNMLVLENGDELKNCYLTPDQRPSRGTYYLSTHHAMAKADALDNFTFKNVNAFIRFTIAEDLTDLVKAVYIFSNNDEEISGPLKMKWNNGDPIAVDVDASSKRTYVRAYNSNGSALKSGDYFLAILPTTFEKGFTMVLQMLDGTQLYKRTEKAVTVSEGQILPMKALNKADYDTDDVNYFVLYNEGFDLNIGGYILNNTNSIFKNEKGANTFLIVTKNRNENVRGKNLFFVTPAADEAVISGTMTDYAVIGMNKKYRSKVTQSGHMGYTEGGNLYLFANLTLTQASDVGFVRGAPQTFGKIVISNCSFQNWSRTLLDMHNGTNSDASTLESIYIGDSEFCFKNCANEYSILLRQGKALALGSFTFVNNIVTSTGTTQPFKFLGGYTTKTPTGGVTLTDCKVSNNTFVNTVGTSFISLPAMQNEFICDNNLFDVPFEKNQELLTVFQPNSEVPLVVPQSGSYSNNYFYTGNEFIISKPSKYTANLEGEQPVRLTVSPLSSIWDPLSGKFGAYTFSVAEGAVAPAYNEVGAQRPDMIPATANLDSAAANYTDVELGEY